VAAVKAQKRIGQDRMRERRQRDHRELPFPERPQTRGGGRHALQAGVGLPHLFKERQRGPGGPQTPCDAFKQREADGLFHARQLAADGWLRRIQKFRRAGHTAGDHHGTEDFDVAMRQHPNSISGMNRSRKSKHFTG